MSNNNTSSSPLGASSAPLPGSLNFRRPAARGRPSLNNLRQQVSKASMRSTIDNGHGNDSDFEGESTFDAGESIMTKTNSQETAKELTACMTSAHDGSFAVGALGQTLLDQQSRMRELLDQIQEHETVELIQDTQIEIAKMKAEQKRLVMEFLKTCNIDLQSSSETSKAEANAFIDSLGVHLPDQKPLGSPSKPSSQNARELRRQKNANAPGLGKDESLVNEIQQQLINEVRRLQALIAERDKALVNMVETAEEAARIKSLHESTIKRLETERDAQDATLYEVERKEELLREENEEVTRQLKKHENELRVLKRQLAEKTDAAETYKASTEDLEQKVEDLRGNVATLRARTVADQKIISGLKVEVNDMELKHRQAVEKIPQSASIASRLSQILDSSGDATQIASANGLVGIDSPNHKRGAHDKALTPTASVDDDLASRLRPNETIKNMETDIAKWRNAAMKYRKKFNDLRRQGNNEGTNFEHDDSTDEEDEETWQDENIPTGSKRSSALRNRIVSSGSRKGKSMGDAFGFGRNKRMSWQSQQDLNENSFVEDDASSIAGSSVRGSLDGFDPHFADPTIRSGGNSKRRSTYTPSSLGARASPLTRTLELTEDARSEADDSYASHGKSSIAPARGVLGDELMMTDNGERQIPESEHEAIVEQSLAERDDAHSQHVQEIQTEHQSVLRKTIAEHEERVVTLQAGHKVTLAKALNEKDAVHAEQMQVIQAEHVTALSQLKEGHARALETSNKRHSEAISAQEKEHENQVNEVESRNETKTKDLLARHTKTHEESMNDARGRHAESLAKQREEAESRLLAMQREHKQLVEERERLHAEEMKRTAGQHERDLRLREKEHQELLEDVQATNESFINQRDAVYNEHIAKRDLIIKEKDQELTVAHTRVQQLEGELESLRRVVEDAEANIARLTEEIESLKSQQSKPLPQTTTEREIEGILPSSSLSQHSHEDFEDAMQGDETAKVPIEKLERGMQTDKEEVVQDDFGHVDVLDVSKSSEILPQEVQTTIPPVPEMPPPPTLSTLLAKARKNGTHIDKGDEFPGRPTSPIPSELIARASQGNARNGSQITSSVGMTSVDGSSTRPSSRLASGPPPSSYMQAGPRRSGPPSVRTRTTSNEGLRRHPMRAPSAQSFVSDATSDFMSGRTSQASHYTNGGVDSSFARKNLRHGEAAGLLSGQASTDPVVLGSITQTMIGDYLYKYTRRSMGRSNKRHRRYFWVHPYTRTLYWTLQAPGEAVSTEVVNKSAFIQDVIVVEDDNQSPPNLYHLSIVISTLNKEVKITARDQKQHDLWVTALGYLVNRELPSEKKQAPSEWRQSISRASLPRNRRGTTGTAGDFSATLTPARRSTATVASMSPSKSAGAIQTLKSLSKAEQDFDRTPRARGASVGGNTSNYPSLLHRRDTAAKEYFEQWEAAHGSSNLGVGSYLDEDREATPRAGAISSMSKRSARSGRGSLAREMFGSARRASASFVNSTGSTRPQTAPIDEGRFKSAEEMLAEDEAKFGYDGLDNVRACCDGKHDIGKLDARGAHHHHHDHGAQKASSSATGSVRSRISTSSLLRRSSRGITKQSSSKDAEARPPQVPNLPPQLGQLNLNNLNTNGSSVDSQTRSQKTIDGKSSEIIFASEFGSLGGNSNDSTPGVVVTDTNATITASSQQQPSTHISYLDRLSQIRRNRASASIR